MPSWTDFNPDVFLQGRPITDAIGLGLEENPRAIAAGVPGAPRIQRAAVEDDAINRAKIETATESVSGTLDIGDSVVVNMDNYSFFPATSGVNITMDAGAQTNPSNPSFRLRNTDTDNQRDYAAAWRYIVA